MGFCPILLVILHCDVAYPSVCLLEGRLLLKLESINLPGLLLPVSLEFSSVALFAGDWFSTPYYGEPSSAEERRVKPGRDNPRALLPSLMGTTGHVEVTSSS